MRTHGTTHDTGRKTLIFRGLYSAFGGQRAIHLRHGCSTTQMPDSLLGVNEFRAAPVRSSRKDRCREKPQRKRNTTRAPTTQGTTQKNVYDRERARQWRKANPALAKQRSADQYEDARVSIRGRAGQLLRSAKARAARNGQTFELTLDWAIACLTMGVCEVTWLPYELQARGVSPRSPSIDQIEPGKGYTRANSQMVVWIYNAAKQGGTHADVAMLAEAVLAREKEKEFA